ncbi:MAG: aminotransferase class V-fold PLP-dependent enzyme [Bacteroidales bacterium]|nr:aminotransferase class V-fold PLP-dependent enzyme [Bacteroidales bacterium]
MKEYPYKSQVLEKLGVRSCINARNWSTNIGGNWIDDRVLDAMNEVARTFVDMHELFAKTDQKVAALCETEEAHITSGAGGAIELAVAGCMAGNNYGLWSRLPHTENMPNEILLHRGHYINYTPQWIASGAKAVEFGIAGTLKSSKRELEGAITEKTCCISYTFSYNNVPRGYLPFEEVVEIAGKYDLPVVVDAASELPPVGNLKKFIAMGADIVCFSGGKAVRAPNNTGFMIGKGKGAEIIKGIRDHSFPHPGWGRGHKVSKEQIVGLAVALEIFTQEGDQLYDQQRKLAEYLQTELHKIPGLSVSIIPNDGISYEHLMMPHVPRVLMEWDRGKIGFNAEDLDRFMTEDDPPIFLRNIHYFNYYSNREWRMIDTFFLRSPEEEIIVERLNKYFRKV